MNADTVIEVRIDFFSPGFPLDSITTYLEQNHSKLLATPVRITNKFNIQTGNRVFKLERKKLEKKTIPSYFFFERYKIRVSYQGQKTTCGYCADNAHVKRNSQKQANMRISAKTSRMQKRMAKSPTKIDNPPSLLEPLPTQEKVAKSFEDNKKKQKKQSKVLAQYKINKNNPRSKLKNKIIVCYRTLAACR